MLQWLRGRPRVSVIAGCFISFFIVYLVILTAFLPNSPIRGLGTRNELSLEVEELRHAYLTQLERSQNLIKQQHSLYTEIDTLHTQVLEYRDADRLKKADLLVPSELIPPVAENSVSHPSSHVRPGSALDTTNTDPDAVTHTKIAVVVLTHARPDDLQKSLNVVVSYLPTSPVKIEPTVVLPSSSRIHAMTTSFDLFVSQDGANPEVTRVIETTSKVFPLIHLKHTDRPKPEKEKPNEPDGYYYIAAHYGFVLKTCFEEYMYDYVILIEEDIEISEDFFNYFAATQLLFSTDDSLFCASAWNDNGREPLVRPEAGAEVLLRSDFFPGLGWMMPRFLWAEIGERWPKAYWDDWLREPENRKGRNCIYPEISRSYTFGFKGTSMGQFANKYLKPTVLNKVNVPWLDIDLSYLLEDHWKMWFHAQVLNSEIVLASQLDNHAPTEKKNLYVEYRLPQERAKLSNTFGLMNDEKAGVPRTSFMGVIPFWHGSTQVFLGPPLQEVLAKFDHH